MIKKGENSRFTRMETTMSKLHQMTCEACKAGAPLATGEEREAFMPQIPDWAVVEREGIERLERVFRFDSYAQALDFTNRVAAIAEDAQHHPAILLEWGRVTVTWWTHKIRGLHRNDFIMAARTDSLESAD